MGFYIDLKSISSVLSQLSLKHRLRFMETQERGELDSAIFYGRIGLKLCPKGFLELHSSLLDYLGSALSLRMQQYRRIEELETLR